MWPTKSNEQPKKNGLNKSVSARPFLKISDRTVIVFYSLGPGRFDGVIGLFAFSQ